MAKVCVVCGETKGMLEFALDRSRPDYKRVWCRPCGRKRRRVQYDTPPPGAPEAKTCSKCNLSKSHREFTRTGREGPRGLSSHCKSCEAAADSARYRRNLEESRRKSRASYYKNNYGITEEDYLRMREAQNGRCAICRMTAGLLRVDHDHSTGLVRGLLCHNCNVGLGHFKDNIELIDSAKRYLDASLKNSNRPGDGSGSSVLSPETAKG